ncbi:MAG: DUF3592 domain-containing protein [Clostridiales bacterium]|nr:DUF3592 domain-containing protein [Clostridiales bacterium]
MSKQELSKEQQEIFEKRGFKNQNLWGTAFILIALIIIGTNFACRFRDSHRYDDYECTRGTVVSSSSYSIPRTHTHRGRYRYKKMYLIEVEYYADDRDRPYIYSHADDDYIFMRRGTKVKVFYDEDDPHDSHIARKDFLTGLYLPAETNYYAALYIAVFPVVIGLYLIRDYKKARKLALAGKLKPPPKEIAQPKVWINDK